MSTSRTRDIVIRNYYARRIEDFCSYPRIIRQANEKLCYFKSSYSSISHLIRIKYLFTTFSR